MSKEQTLLNVMDYIDSLSSEQQLEIWYRLNCRETVPSLINILSDDDLSKLAGEIMEYIESHLGQKATLRYWHIHQLGSTDRQFEDWWDSMLYNQQYELHNRNSPQNDIQSERNGFFFSTSVVSAFIAGFTLAALFFRFVC